MLIQVDLGFDHICGFKKDVATYTRFWVCPSLTLIRLGFPEVVFFWKKKLIFQEELIQYQDNFIQLLNNLLKIGWR